MTYSCVDFTDSILEALKVSGDLPEASNDSPSDQADLAIARIEGLQHADVLVRKIASLSVPRGDISAEEMAVCVTALRKVQDMAKDVVAKADANYKAMLEALAQDHDDEGED